MQQQFYIVTPQIMNWLDKCVVQACAESHLTCLLERTWLYKRLREPQLLLG